MHLAFRERRLLYYSKTCVATLRLLSFDICCLSSCNGLKYFKVWLISGAKPENWLKESQKLKKIMKNKQNLAGRNYNLTSKTKTQY